MRKGVENKSNDADLSIVNIIHSLLASFFGVQTQANMDRDEKHIEKHGIKLYIITGFILVFCLLLTLFGIVKLIVSMT